MMFKMIFEFKRGDSCVEAINAALSGLRLSGLKIEDSDGYLATTTQYKDGVPVSTSYRYGLDRIEFECERDEGAELRGWQMDAAALSKAELADSQSFADRWREAHPDRVMRVLQQVGYNDADAFVVLHHERK